MNNNREKAMEWWNRMTLEQQFYQVIPWLKSNGMMADDRHPHSLTGREIEHLFEKYKASLL